MGAPAIGWWWMPHVKCFKACGEGFSSGELTNVSIDMLEKEIIAEAESSAEFSLQPVINATGVILHTNLGRAPLAPQAVEHLIETATRYSNLEYEIEKGERGKRDTHTARLFARLLGAEMHAGG